MTDEIQNTPETSKSATPIKAKSIKKRPTKQAKTKTTEKKAIPARPFPRTTLEEAIKIPLAIRHKNGGNPWDSSSVANAVGFSKSSNGFFYLSAASRDFGLTIGTRDTAEISLTELGRRLAYAETPEE